MSIESDLAALRQKANTAREEKARQAARAEAMAEKIVELKDRLSTEFGCTTLAEAQAKLAADEASITARLDQIKNRVSNA